MLCAMVGLTMMFASIPPLHVDGDHLADPSGHRIQLRGCNLGNWFMIEQWMWDQEQPEGSSQDYWEFERLLEKRFGKFEAARLMDLHRASWITDRDFDIIESFRFNVVRLPLYYEQFEDDANPMHLRKDAWKWCDHAVDMAGRHGVYVILDMHGAQGGQNTFEHSGHRDQNKLWTSEEDQKRLAWLWGEMARHYRQNSAVVAYDVFNEPFGGTHEQIRSVFEKCYASIRQNDPDKLVWAAAKYDGFGFYGDPKTNGFHNVGFEDHYYPGLFGNGPGTVRTHQRHFATIREDVAPSVAKVGVPFLVGEMNVVFGAAGGAQMMRRSYDLYESYGWTTTMWAYKTYDHSVGDLTDSWCMVENAKPFKKLNFATATKAEIEHFLRDVALGPYKINEPLRKAMAPMHVDYPPLPPVIARKIAPQGALQGWLMVDVGGALPGGLEVKGDDGFDLYGGGADIWGQKDDFRYLYKEVEGDFDLTVTVHKVEPISDYTKAGLMIRAGSAPDAPFVMLSAFPSGDLQLCHRDSSGANVAGVDPVVSSTFPVKLRLMRRGDLITVQHAGSDGVWHEVGHIAAKWVGSQVSTGVVALSHDSGELAKIEYSDLRLAMK